MAGDARVEEAEVLGDFGNGGDGRFAGAFGYALFDGDGKGDALEVVDIGARHLLDELPGIGGHGFHEATLPFGEEDVEGEGGLAGSGNSGEDGERVALDGEVDVLQVVLSCSTDGEGAAGVFGFVGSGGFGYGQWRVFRKYFI